MAKKNPASLSFDTLRLEGALFLPDTLEKAARGELTETQSVERYQIPKGITLQDEYGRAFQIAQAQWKAFAATLERQDVDAVRNTRQFVQELLRDALGYAELQEVGAIEVGERRYPIGLLARGRVPVVIAPHSLDLDDPDTRFAIQGSGTRKKSAFQLAQEFLNASPECTWALVSNGRQLRLLRDAATLTRPSYLEFDLQAILQDARYPDFAAGWRLLHASRAGLAGTPGSECVWEEWRLEGQRQGTRVREGLREGVTAALIALGEGFLQHPDNEALRRKLVSGELLKSDPDGDGYYQQLLRLVYRFIFLFTVEERGVLHAPGEGPAQLAARRIYNEGYALSRLRDRCLRRTSHDRYGDLWQGVRIVFNGLGAGETRLDLPALGGLFDLRQCPDLDQASLSNQALLTVMRHLRWSKRVGQLAPVDYRNMGPEELGSVYESLLELEPHVDVTARLFSFIGLVDEGSTAGNARKLSGSYYTPDSLVQELIKTALDPVIEARVAANPTDPTGALLAIRVIDPACGSGHFLLAAARRLAERLAALRAPEGAVRPGDYRHALREVIGRCIFGVDRNPMALELARTALWLEGYEEGLPLSFLDHHLVCGDALIGLTDLKQLTHGIPDAAFKPLSGEDKAICKEIGKENKEGLKAFAKRRDCAQFSLTLENADALTELEALEAMPADTTGDIAAKEAAYAAFLQHARSSRLAHAADLFVGAFLAPKARYEAISQTPTSKTLYLELFSDSRNAEHEQRLVNAQRLCVNARVLHWPLAFPQVFARGGFDCVLGNPPWEVSQLGEEEYFATRAPQIAALSGDARKRAIAQLPEVDIQLWNEYLLDKRRYEASNTFFRESSRFPLTAVGKINTYPLFAEAISQIVSTQGRAGFIVPTGIATDDSTKAYFAHIALGGLLASLYDFENRAGLFPAVDSRMKFCLLTLGQAETAEFAFFLTDTSQLADERRRFALSPEDFRLINPNTRTCPVFRSRKDAELTKQIYARVPVLIREAVDSEFEQTPWGVRFMQGLFNMTSDSHLFADSDGPNLLPLYEAKMIHQFDHRWVTYREEDGKDASGDVKLVDKQNPAFAVHPRYWVDASEVEVRLQDRGWNNGWLMGWRDICRATDERTVIASVVPRVGVGHTSPLFFVGTKPTRQAALLANLNSLTLDFAARQKVGGTHLTYLYLKQFPVLPPDAYTDTDLAFIVPRVLELTYTAHDLKPWAQDLGYEGEPFPFDADALMPDGTSPGRRAVIRAELDAWYARAYGLSLDELRYVLDPEAVMGAGYPSETFRVLKNNEQKAFGEYRTAKLVLNEFKRMKLAEATGELYESLLVPPPGQTALPVYSPYAAIRDEDDARLAGLVITLIRAAGSLPRQQVVMALTLAAAPEQAIHLMDGDALESLRNYHQQHAAMLAAERIQRLHTLLEVLENTRAIRVEQQGMWLTAVSDAPLPTRLIVAPDTNGIAGMLLRAAKASLEQFADSADEIASTAASKRA